MYDPVTHHLFLLDGLTERLFELTLTGQLVRSLSLPAALEDAEGMAYDPERDLFYIGSGASRGKIFEVDRREPCSPPTFPERRGLPEPRGGGKPKIKGLELAPSSDPNDGNHRTLYAVDYGNDQVADGRLFEIDLHPDWPVA